MAHRRAGRDRRRPIRGSAAVARVDARGACVNVGLVGCGVIAHNYVKGSAAFPSFDIVACADVSAAAAEAFGETYSLRVLSVEELVSDPEIEVVLSLTPPAAHAEIARAAFAYDKHVYMEKPLAATLDEARSLVGEAAARGVRLGGGAATFLPGRAGGAAG